MTKRKTPDQLIEDYLRGKSSLSRAYRKAAQEEPPHALNEGVLAAARRAVRTRPRTARSPFVWFWAVPLSAAAVIVLSLGLAMFMTQEGVAPLPLETVLDATKKIDQETMAGLQSDRLSESLSDESTTAMRKRAAKADVPESAPADAPMFKAAIKEKKMVPVESTDVAAPVPVIEERTGLSTGHADPRLGVLAKRAEMTASQFANIISVQMSGNTGAYQFSVGIVSPDTGCKQYADWWEVVSVDGRLLYRRILSHSHVSEQPFVRSGGPVAVAPDTVVWVRAHMHPDGYGGDAFKGSVTHGFKKEVPGQGFGAELETSPPQPDGCAF
jgi:hypothetical protein